MNAPISFVKPKTGERYFLVGSHTSTVREGLEPTVWPHCEGCLAAQAIEARSGQTACGLDPKGESAVGAADAPESSTP